MLDTKNYVAMIQDYAAAKQTRPHHIQFSVEGNSLDHFYVWDDTREKASPEEISAEQTRANANIAKFWEEYRVEVFRDLSAPGLPMFAIEKVENLVVERMNAWALFEFGDMHYNTEVEWSTLRNFYAEVYELLNKVYQEGFLDGKDR